MRYVPICDGELVSSGAVAPKCSGQWLLNIDASGIPGAFDISLLDPVAVANAIGSGFLLVAPCLLLIVGGRMVLYPFFHK